MADIRWIKLTVDMFDNRKIKYLRKLPEGDSIVLIWVMLLTMAGRCNSGGMIFLTENIPYTPKLLADELDFEENTVVLALDALERLGMVSFPNGCLAIAGWEEHQNIEGMEKIRESKRLAQARWRAKQNALPAPVDSTVDSTEISQRVSVDYAEEDKEIDKDKNKTKNKKEKKKESYSDDPYLNDAILSFIEFRKSMKKPMTDHAIKLLINKLNGMTDSVQEQIAILNQSIMNGWTSVYELKERTEGNGKHSGNRNFAENHDAQRVGHYI